MRGREVSEVRSLELGRRSAKEGLRRVISTPAPSTKVSALGFSTDTVISSTGKLSSAVLAIRAASASNVSKDEYSTTCETSQRTLV